MSLCASIIFVDSIIIFYVVDKATRYSVAAIVESPKYLKELSCSTPHGSINTSPLELGLETKRLTQNHSRAI